MTMLRLLRRTLVRPVAIVLIMVFVLLTVYNFDMFGDDESRLNLNSDRGPDHSRKPFQWTTTSDRAADDRVMLLSCQIILGFGWWD